MYTASGTSTCDGTANVQSRIEGVQRFHLRQSVFYGLVNWRVRFWNHSLSVQGIARPHSLVYTVSSTCTCKGNGNV